VILDYRSRLNTRKKIKGNIQKNGNCGFKQTTLADAPDKAPAEDYRM
jgi:hypothetical protein